LTIKVFCLCHFCAMSGNEQVFPFSVGDGTTITKMAMDIKIIP
jgi:hypothetical protein